jgi:hypothetical protein
LDAENDLAAKVTDKEDKPYRMVMMENNFIVKIGASCCKFEDFSVIMDCN